MKKIRYRERSLWKVLIKYLNTKSNHDIYSVYKACDSIYEFRHRLYAPPSDNTVTYFLHILEKHKIIKKYRVINQNGNPVEKIDVPKRIPKKITPNLLRQFDKQPWLRWFMYPE